jgi:hypothetical protein
MNKTRTAPQPEDDFDPAPGRAFIPFFATRDRLASAAMAKKKAIAESPRNECATFSL